MKNKTDKGGKGFLVGSIILFIIFAVGFPLMVIFTPLISKSVGKDAWFLVGGGFLISVACGWGSNFLMKLYREDSDNKKFLSTFFYIFTFVASAIGWIVAGIVILVIYLITHSDSTNTTSTKYEVKDKYGNKSTLEKNYYGDYSDGKGNRYDTNDGGNTFYKK